MNLFQLRTLTCIILFGFAFNHAAYAGVITFGSGVNQFGMEFVGVGSPGNVDDTAGNPNPAGAVGYAFQMGKFEVSEDMINKANASGGLGITKDTRGINKPTTGVSWNEAARFVNWLNTSTGGFAAYKFTTGAANDNISLWTTADTLDFDAANPFRSKRSNYVLPSVDEWYKAAYYDPSTGTYFKYPTGSNVPPVSVISGVAAGTAVIFPTAASGGPADITQAGGLSPFGTMGQGGNVFEWEETSSDLANSLASSNRGVRGGVWNFDHTNLLSSSRLSSTPGNQSPVIGFRVASLSASEVVLVPEPSSLVLLLTGMVGLLWHGRKQILEK